MRTWKVNFRRREGGKSLFSLHFHVSFSRPPHIAMRELALTLGGRLRIKHGYELWGCVQARSSARNHICYLKISVVLWVVYSFFWALSNPSLKSGWEWPPGPCNALGENREGRSHVGMMPQRWPERCYAAQRQAKQKPGGTHTGASGKQYRDAHRTLRRTHWRVLTPDN